MEDATLARVFAVSEAAAGSDDPTYREGLRAAVAAALDYGLAGIEPGSARIPPIPPTLLSQARLAARSQVGLDTVLRRYLVGYTLLNDYVIREAEVDPQFSEAVIKQILRNQASLFDRLLIAVSQAHAEELQLRSATAEQRRSERVERLLAGEPLETAGLEYDFEANHLGIVAAGPGAVEAIRRFAVALEQRLLLVRRREATVWAWFGGRRRLDSEVLARAVPKGLSSQVVMAIGEPGEGFPGWRLTHRQAQAAFAIARRGSQRVVGYAEVALLAAISQDELVASSLRRLFLDPLEEGRDGGETLRETLRAYLSCGLKVSPAAAALRVSRQTVTSRLRLIEERLGRPLSLCATEIDLALRLDSLDRRSL